MTNIFVGNLSYGASEDTLRALFESYGPVDRVSIITDRESGRSRGFGFVEMSDDSAAAKAISGLNGRDHDGRKLNINEARAKAERGARDGGYDRRSRW